MQRRKLGPLEVSAIGYGAMGLEGYYGSIGQADAIETIRHALDCGITLLDTADAYGDGHNEALLAQAINGRNRDAIVIATKFGIVFDPDERGTSLTTGWGFSLNINGRPEYAQRALDASLKRLGVEYIDLWYLHYPDPATPIQETVGAMAEQVHAGKVRYLGLSNVTAEQVRHAHEVHPISAVQYEYSLWRREAEQTLLPTTRDLGIGCVAWGPLGTGFLAGMTRVAEDDFRYHNPRYQGENRQHNEERFAPLSDMAKELGITAAQLALAWLLHQGSNIVPIPGTRQAARVEENAAAVEIVLTPEHLARIDQLAPAGLHVETPWCKTRDVTSDA
ncbi:MAG: aldo/keto reductase [Chloroflexaceae bacterium]|nr:aldo/keto reductase [Chloroflexaceae bacterium]